MRILNLQAENFRILRAVEIAPDGNVVTIGGKNGAGKSSVLDAIWVALAGRSKAPPTPIRNGEQKCTIRLDLGDIIVTRTLTAPKDEGKTYTDTVKIESADGKTRYNKPQVMLDELMGQIGFDPFSFVQRKPDDQAAMLLDLVPLSIDLEELASADALDYAARTARNREAEQLAGQVAGIRLPDDVPTEPVDRDAILTALSSAADTNMAIERERSRRERIASDIDMTRNQADIARQSAERLRHEADEQDALAKRRDGEAGEAQKAFGALPVLGEPVDTAKLRADLAAAESTNALIQQAAQRADLVAQRDAKTVEAQRLTDMMAAREQERRNALASAKMPIAGLGFGVDAKGKPTVLFNGLPFGDASSAEQIRASTAIAMAGNPDLRVLRIKDGSLLDEDSMAIIAGMAAHEDFQVWCEVVGTGGVGIVIEDGSIKGAGGPDHDAPPAEEKPAAKTKAAPAKPEGSLL